MTKKYVLKGDCFRLETTFEVDGEHVGVSFSGGKKVLNRHGYFVTSDKELQEAIESSPSFGVMFDLEISEDYPAEEAEIPVVEEPEAEEPENVPAPVEPVIEEVIVEDPVVEPVVEPVGEEPVKEESDENLLSVTNYTLAKLYIKAKFPEVTRPEIISEDKLKQYAKEKGITFPNW